MLFMYKIRASILYDLAGNSYVIQVPVLVENSLKARFENSYFYQQQRKEYEQPENRVG